MTESTDIPTGLGLDEWRARSAVADQVRAIYLKRRAALDADSDGTDAAAEFIRSTDPLAFVGAHHHVVPRFLLERWADSRGHVRVYTRVDEKFTLRNIKNLAIKDFHTFIDREGNPNSLLESLLGEVEAPAASILRRLLGGLSGPAALTDADLATLAQFASFQVTRTPRHRRVMELNTEWYVKTMARGTVPEEELESLTIAPHQNDLVRLIGTLAEEMFPLFRARPLALVTLDRPLLLIGDDPIVINPGAGEVVHSRDCFLTDDQIAERDRRNRRRHRRQGRQGRVVHMWSPVPSGVGTALELVLPVSPRSALVWGELGPDGSRGELEQVLLKADDADRFAQLLNDATCERALDWVVAQPDDPSFTSRTFAPHGPLIRVCDGSNAASLALNSTPSPIRPHRLTNPTANT